MAEIEGFSRIPAQSSAVRFADCFDFATEPSDKIAGLFSLGPLRGREALSFLGKAISKLSYSPPILW